MEEHGERDEGEDDEDDGVEQESKDEGGVALFLDQDEFCAARMKSVDVR